MRWLLFSCITSVHVRMQALFTIAAPTSPAPLPLEDGIDLFLPETFIASLAIANPLLVDLLRANLRSAALINGSYVVEGGRGDVRAFLKCYRAVVLLLADGRVRSREHAHFEDGLEFFSRDRENAFRWLLSLGSFDDRAALFTNAQMDLALVQNRTWLDGKDSTAEAAAEAEVRFVEYFLNSDFRRTGINMDELLEREDEKEEEERDEALPFPSLRPLRADLRQRLLSELVVHRKKEHARAVAQFREYLDRGRILPVMRAAGLNGCRWYNWLVGQDREGRVNQDLGRQRLEALEGYPLIHCAASKFGSPVSLAIENGTSLLEAISEFFRCSKAEARALRGIDVNALGLPSAPDKKRVEAVVETLRLTPGLPRPRDTDGWKAFFASIKAARVLCGVIGAKEEEALPRLLGSLASDWGAVSLSQMSFMAASIPDIIEDIMEFVIYPAAFHYPTRILKEKVAQALFGSRGMKELLEVVLQWENERRAIKERIEANWPLLGGQSREDAWPSLHEDPVGMSNGVQIHCLATEKALKVESERLQHCVDSYVGKCLYSGCHIISMRTETGDSLSTAQIDHYWLVENAGKRTVEDRGVFDRRPPGVVQHRGRRNSEPPVRAKQALSEYINRIVSGAITLDLDTLQESLEYRVANKALGGGRSFNYRELAAVEDAWREYRVLFPKKTRRLNLRAFMGSLNGDTTL